MRQNNLGQFIKELREGKGFSVRELAEKANVSHTEIFRIEKGERTNPSPATLKAIAIALNTPIEKFLAAGGYMEVKAETPIIAARLKGAEDLSKDELNQVQQYIEFLKSRRDKSK